MGDPTAGALPQVSQLHAPGAHTPGLPLKAPHEAADIGIAQADAPVWKKNEADEIHPALRRREPELIRVDAQAQRLHILPHPLALSLQSGAVVTEEQKVIHIAQVALCPQLVLDEEVEGMQVDVGEKLAGQVTDGESAWMLDNAEEITRIRPFLCNAVSMAGEDAVDDFRQ